MGQIYLEERGQGPPALFVHGLGSGRVDFAEVADLLAPTRRCLLVDLPGHGDAGPSDGGSPADHAASLLPLIRRRAPLDVIGLSFGALVALELWQMAPQALGSLVLLDPPLVHGPLLEWARARAGSDGDATRVLLGVYAERVPERLVELMRGHPLTRDLDDHLLRRTAATQLAADSTAMLGCMRRLATHQLPRRRPSASDARVTIVRASPSVVCPPEAAAELAEALGADTIAIESGHCMQLEVPRQLAQVLEDVLARSASHGRQA